MKQRYTIYALFLLSLFVSISASAQIKGVITDSLTNEPLMYITVQYEGKGVGGISNANGEYQVETRKGWDELTFSAVGYITKKVKLKPGTRVLNVKLQSDDIMLSEVVVKPKKEKYSRKNNPAVEFMKKVIENKKALKLEENDYYQYQKYEKMKMSLNDVTPDKMEKGIYKKFSFFKDQVEVSPKTNKMILPISIKETASKTIFRKSPKSEKTIIEGMNSAGIEEFFNTGDMLGTILTDVFSDINIYDDDIRLLQRRFVSPIGHTHGGQAGVRASDFRSAEPAGLRFHGAPLRGEGLHLCREEMYHEPAQEDGCQLRGKPRHRAAVRTTARRKLGADR